MVGMLAANGRRVHQPGTAEYSEMRRNARLREAEARGEIVHRRVTRAEHFEQAHPRFVRKRLGGLCDYLHLIHLDCSIC